MKSKENKDGKQGKEGKENKDALRALIKTVPSETIPIKKIVFDDRNPNKMSTAQMGALDKIVEKYGFAVDPWVNRQKDGTFMVIDGEHRVRLLIQKGATEVQAKVFKVSYREVRKLRQYANKLRGIHDKKADALEFRDIYEAGDLEEFADFLATPIEDFERALAKEFDMDFEVKEDEEIPEPPAKPKSKPGEIYALGRHRLLCGDCTDPANASALLGRHKIAVIFTDPPYGVGYEQGKYSGVTSTKKPTFKPIQNDNLTGEDMTNFIDTVFIAIAPNLDNTPVYCCAPTLAESFSIFNGLRRHLHIQCQIIWAKAQLILGRGDYHWMHEVIWYGYTGNPHFWCGDRSQTTVWQFPVDPHQSYQHPTQKPVSLALKAIKNSSRDKEIVYDAFAGSGSTLIAAEQSGRTFYGMELEPAYIDVAIQRWENFTKKKAKLLKTLK